MYMIEDFLFQEEEQVDENSPLYRLGEMLTSAVRRGGLLNALLWPAWLKGLDDKVLIEGSLLSIDMIVKDQPVRWFADPHTAMLIVQWRKSRSSVPPDVTPKECMEAFGSRDPEEDDACGIQLVKTAAKDWSMRLPGLLSAYAQGNIPGASISYESWFRIVHGDVMPRQVLEQPGKEEDRKTERAPNTLMAGMKAEFSALKPLISPTIPPTHRAKALRKAALESLQSLPARHRMTALRSWCLYVLRNGKGRKGGYSVNTTRSYLASLIHIFDDWDLDDGPEAVPSDQLQHYIRTFLSEEKDGARRNKLISAFMSFERYRSDFREEEKVSHIDLSDFRAEQRASPGLILPEEYERLVRFFDDNGDDQFALLTILLFRTGLRLPEAVGLRCGDILRAGDRYELVVEKNEGRELKNGLNLETRRIIPLDILLEDDELTRLKRHLQAQRQRCAPGQDGWLFGPADALYPPQWKVARDVIEPAMKRFAKRSGLLRHEHLRHSFASYLLATLMLPPDVPEPPVPRRLMAVISPQRRERVADRLLGQERLGGGALHAVSRVMGHTGPDTTLRYYIHLLDWSLGLYCARPSSFQEIETDQLCQMAKVSADAYRKARGRLRPPAPGAFTVPSRPSEAQLCEHSPEIQRKRADIVLLQAALRRSARLFAVEFTPSTRELREDVGKKIKSREWLKPHAVPVKSMLGLFAGQVRPSGQDRYHYWEKAAASLLPDDFWQKRGRHLLSLKPEYLTFIEDRLNLRRPVGTGEVPALKSAARSYIRNRKSSEIMMRRLKEGATFVKMLSDAMGFRKEDLELRHSCTLPRKRGSTDLHAFLSDRSVIPELSGRLNWRGSLAVRLRSSDLPEGIMFNRACRLMIILLTLHTLAAQMEQN